MASDLPLAQRPAPATMPARMPALLSFLAGYVDSCTFLALFGLFVAQVTGSFVLAGTLFVTHHHGVVIKIMAIPAFFLAGVGTTVIVRRLARRRSPADARIAAEYAGIRDRLAVLGPIVLGFLAGTIAGAVAYVGLDLWCVLVAVVATAGLAAWASLGKD